MQEKTLKQNSKREGNRILLPELKIKSINGV